MELSESLVRQLLDAAPDATVVVSADGIIRFANARLEHVFGYARDEVIGRPVECLLPERLRTAHPKERERYFSSPTVRPMGVGLDLYGLHRDGHEIPVEISLSPITTADGPLVISAIRDVTDQRETERELAEANRAKSRFLAAASHDLRQPLQALNLLTGAAARRAGGDKTLEGIVERQQRALDSMSGLLNSLLDISKLDAGLVAPELEHFAVDDVLNRIAVDFADPAAAKGLELEVVPSDDVAYTDPELLRRLLMNLVANALRYTREGRIVVSCRRDGEHLAIDISDTGLGIAPEETERIFEEFYQIDRGTTRLEGLGLGLSIVRRLATLLGFELALDSEPGRGTRFRVLVPAGRSARGARPVSVEAEPLPPGLRVLLIDDEPAVIDATTMLLELEGLEVDVAGNSPEALASVGTRVPDVIISDFHLCGEETGADVVARVRGALEDVVPVIFITGDTRRAVAEHGLARAELLTKPLNDRALFSAIRRCVGEPLSARGA